MYRRAHSEEHVDSSGYTGDICLDMSMSNFPDEKNKIKHPPNPATLFSNINLEHSARGWVCNSVRELRY